MESTLLQGNAWPELRWEDWSATAETLHMWTQIVGKTRLALSPLQAHWWNVPLYVSARGLNTSAMPYGAEFLEIDFDFVSHELRFRLSTGASASTPLRAQSVADFYAEYQKILTDLGVPVSIYATPVEVAHPIPFAQDVEHASYDPDAAHRFWRVLMRTDQVFQKFSSRFVGKVSPIHFFWGSFDLAVTRFSGRPARRSRSNYTRGLLTRGHQRRLLARKRGYCKAAFYCYAAPAPKGLDSMTVEPAQAKYDQGLGEFILLYEDLRQAPSPDEALLAFLQSTYEAAAGLAKRDRKSLERQPF
jgi:hypothetical protein